MAPVGKKLNTLSTPKAKNVLVQKCETVSIRALLVFLNDTLDCDLRSMDELKTGAVYCQIMHRLFPTTIQIQKVKFYTNYKSDFEINFRLLHNCMTKLNIKRYMPVEELIVGHNHVDFCNWLYKFYRFNDDGKEYDARKVRKDMPIGLSKTPELASFATGSHNAMYKCQSMIFNYAKETSRFQRSGSLDGRSCRPTKSKKPEPEKQTKPLLLKKEQPPKDCEFLADCRKVSLPPETEDEREELSAEQSQLQKLFMERLNAKKKGLSAETYTIKTSKNSTNYSKPKEFTSFKALSQEFKQATKDLQNRNEIISHLNYEISRLTTKQEMLAKKVWTVEQILTKYGNNPAYAVQELKEIIFNNSQMAAVSPRTKPEYLMPRKDDGTACSKYVANKQKPVKNSMPTRYCSEFRTCLEISPKKEGKKKKAKEPNFGEFVCDRCHLRDDHRRLDHEVD
ncbi:microtubule-associated protein RP/EB family member 1 isoform X1 [Drosophila takahashii]|uniref:microtubule-associated protein RP/EB family member 1 isoform X1 n=1 Tax=Drosophila takahashii TaxID=29030 RepID=UPI001CF8BC43|nr:uncharacterized protein LOC108069160 [Drosophila takahashii]